MRTRFADGSVMVMLRRCAVASLMATALPRTSHAQSAPRDSSKSAREICGTFNRPGISSVAGIVREPNGAPIPYATVTFEGGYTTMTIAERSGCFVVRSPRNGQVTVDVRRIGFHPYTQPVDLSGDSTVFIDVRLSSVATPVNGVTVTAPRNDAMEKTGFYDRLLERTKGVGDGYFITPEDIERRNEDKVSHLIEGYPNILVVQDGLGRGQVWGRGHSINVNGGVMNSVLADKCLMTLFLDGGRLPTGQTLDVLDLSTAIAAIEIYPTPMQTPPQFQTTVGDGACGAIVVWTKRPDFTRHAGSWFKENLLTIIALPAIVAAVIITLGRRP